MKTNTTFPIAVAVIALAIGTFLAPQCQAQFFSNSGATSDYDNNWWWPYQSGEKLDQPKTRRLTPEEAQNFIVIQGTAEVRVDATSMRLVLGNAIEHDDPDKCEELSKQRIKKVVKEWKTELGISDKKIFEDFVSFLVVESFEMTREDFGAATERSPSYYRYETNLHVELKDHAQARKAIEIAFRNGIKNIAAFNYWHSDLDSIKKESMKKAIAAAKEKSDILLSLFDQRPPLINVQEESKTNLPESMYESYHSGLATYAKERFFGWTSSTEKSAIAGHYYKGPNIEADVRSKEIALIPKISTVTTVTLYFQSPSTKKSKGKSPKGKSNETSAEN